MPDHIANSCRALRSWIQRLLPPIIKNAPGCMFFPIEVPPEVCPLDRVLKTKVSNSFVGSFPPTRRPAYGRRSLGDSSPLRTTRTGGVHHARREVGAGAVAHRATLSVLIGIRGRMRCRCCIVMAAHARGRHRRTRRDDAF